MKKLCNFLTFLTFLFLVCPVQAQEVDTLAPKSYDELRDLINSRERLVAKPLAINEAQLEANRNLNIFSPTQVQYRSSDRGLDNEANSYARSALTLAGTGLQEGMWGIWDLTADAFGVLPPISKLTPSQAAFHFISGYTAKVAGTEAGVVEPVPSFSACFGAPFMPLHPTEYADMLSKKMKEAGVNVWLVNTGWTGGPYGVGTRMKLKYTRAMINAALNGDLGDYTYENYHIHSVFGVAQPRSCPGVPTAVLSPRTTWNDDEAYYKMAFKLSNAFRKNFKQFEANASEEIRRGGPQRYAF